MGIGMVVMFWGVVGLIAATIGSLILPLIASDFTKGKAKDSRGLLLAIRLFPFACLVWAGGVFIVYAVVNDVAFHRDPAIGDGWWCPLPNGYAIEMIDVTDRASLYNPKTQDINSSDALSEVGALQLAGRYMLGGARCRKDVPHGPHDHDAVLSYFMLDTGSGSRSEFSKYEALRTAAAQANIQVHLDPIEVVYNRYRLTWFDAVAAAAMFGVPLFCAWLLFRWVVRIRKYGSVLPQPA